MLLGHFPSKAACTVYLPEFPGDQLVKDGPGWMAEQRQLGTRTCVYCVVKPISSELGRLLWFIIWEGVGDGAPKKGLGTAQLLDTELGDLVLGQVGPG